MNYVSSAAKINEDKLFRGGGVQEAKWPVTDCSEIQQRDKQPVFTSRLKGTQND